MPTIAEKLMIRLRSEVSVFEQIPPDARIVRVRRGHWGKSAGTWAWTVEGTDGRHFPIGSEDTMADCLNAKRLTALKLLRGGDILINAECDPMDMGVELRRAKHRGEYYLYIFGRFVAYVRKPGLGYWEASTTGGNGLCHARRLKDIKAWAKKHYRPKGGQK